MEYETTLLDSFLDSQSFDVQDFIKDAVNEVVMNEEVVTEGVVTEGVVTEEVVTKEVVTEEVVTEEVVTEDSIGLDKKCFMTEVMDGVLSTAWKEIMKSKPKSDVPNIQKTKHYACDKCGKLFAQYVSALKHCTVSKPPDIGAKCPICDIKILLKRNLKRHIKNVHNSQKKDRMKKQTQASVPKCEVCETVFSSKHKLVEHMQKKHGAARKEGDLVHCNECEFSNVSESRVKAHVTLKHSSKETFKCPVCNLLFKSRSGLQKHVRKVHETPAMSSQTGPSNQPTDIGTKDKESFPVSDPPPSAQSISPPVLPNTTWFERQNPSQSVVSGQNYPPFCFSGQNPLLAGFPGQNTSLGLAGYLEQNISPSVFSGQNLSPSVPNPSPNSSSDLSHHAASFLLNKRHNPDIQVRNPPPTPSALSPVPENLLGGSHNGSTYKFPNIVTESGYTYQIL